MVKEPAGRRFSARVLVFIFFVVLAFTSWVSTSGGAGAATSNARAAGTASPSAAPSPSASASQAPTSAPAAAASNAAAGSGMAFESTMLMYQSAVVAAQNIADALSRSAAKKKILVLTQADLSTLGSLQIVLSQGNTLDTQVTMATQRIHEICIPPPPKTNASVNVSKNSEVALNVGSVVSAALGITGPVQLGAATAQAVAAWITSLSQISAVTETLSSSQGALSDQAFMVLVAGDIRAEKSSTIIVPSFYSPKSLAPSSGTQLSNLLNNLEKDRATLLKAALNLPLYKPCLPTTDAGKRINQQVAAISIAVDAFEASLLNGNNPTAAGAFGATVPFQQLLAADQLSNMLATSGNNIGDYFVAVIRAGDSGGSSLTKQSVFLGSRQYYSGGAGAYYMLFNADDASLACAGYGYGYHGFIAAGDVGLNGLGLPIPHVAATPVGALYHDGDKLPAVVSDTSSGC